MAEIGEIPGTWRVPLAPQNFDAVSKTPEATTDERWERLQNRQTRVTKQIEFELRNNYAIDLDYDKFRPNYDNYD